MSLLNLLRTPPETQGVSSAAILTFVDAVERKCHDLHSVMLLRHGAVIAEGWWSPYQPDAPHMLFSLSKSFTSTAAGLAIGEGRFSMDDAVLSFFPDETPAEVSDHLAAMRVRHLLSMSTGHADDTWALMIDRPDGNWARGFFETPLRHAPGTHFLYNTGATYMLAAIVQRTTGMKLVDYLTPRLFEPLGIDGATWEESPQGIAAGGLGLSIPTEGIARFGQMLLQKGLWQGRQILPEAWVEEATALHMPTGSGHLPDWSYGYGYQFWRSRHNAYHGNGVFGQFCVVMPDQDAVLAITGGVDVLDSQEPFDLLWEHLLPAMAAGPLPDDPETAASLARRLAGLALAPVQGKSASPIAAAVSGRTFRFEPNPLRLETLALDFDGGVCTVRITSPTGEEQFPFGLGTWGRGRAALFNERGMIGQAAVAASGAWTGDDTFTMLVRLVETPFYTSIVFCFAGDELMIESRISVSLEARPALLMTARAP